MIKTYKQHEVAKAGRVTPSVVREWEAVGYLKNVQRSAGNQRVYTDEHMQTAIRIAALRGIGFNTDIIYVLATWTHEFNISICNKINDLAVDLNELNKSLQAYGGDEDL